MTPPAPSLPRLLYIADVPVESTYHGSALMFRLLETYPADRLEIVEAGSTASLTGRRLSGITYHSLQPASARLQTTRFSSWYDAAMFATAKLRTARLKKIASAFKPDAILTVTHGNSWISAAHLARHLRIPLHLVCHDDWQRTRSIGVLDRWADRFFRDHYRAAASRLCVSPFMARTYEERYGAKGRVLYPSRAAGASSASRPPERLGKNLAPFTCAFAGTINSKGVVEALAILARCLEKIDGVLSIYGPLDAAQARASGLGASNIVLHGLLSSGQLMTELEDKAGALFVPMSFADGDRANMESGFPSKLTDYTATGVPLLIYGPEYCSAAQWAVANPGVAEVVTSPSEDALMVAVSRLASEPAHRLELAAGSIEAGIRYFSHDAAFEVFAAALVSNNGYPPGSIARGIECTRLARPPS